MAAPRRNRRNSIPQAPAIDGELTDGQYEIFVVDRAGGTAGLVVEDSSLTAPNSGTLLTKGAFGFTDADLTDTHTATVIGSPVVDASHAPGFVVPAGGLGTFTPLAVTESAGSGQVPWSFTVDNALVQSLGKGQYITQTYAVQLDDHHGGHPTQNVTVTIAGVNDAPVVTSASLTISQGHTVTTYDRRYRLRRSGQSRGHLHRLEPQSRAFRDRRWKRRGRDHDVHVGRRCRRACQLRR